MDWDDMDDEDWPSPDELMLWPDQCVGVSPRCYFINEEINNESVVSILQRLFENGTIPSNATHVQVDCRADAVALSKLVYAVSDSFQKSMPYVIACAATVLIILLVALMCCCYGCARLCIRPDRHNQPYPPPPMTGQYQYVTPVAIPIKDLQPSSQSPDVVRTQYETIDLSEAKPDTTVTYPAEETV
jgi:hypothetical protein